MARPLRIEYAGAYYHVINRGNAGEDIFDSKRDKERFLEYLEKSIEHFSIIIHTYCLMSNHYHLLIETPQPNLSQAIQWLNVSYAAYYNNKHQRSGHLFQGRFKAILVEADAYLKELSRYIHLNPVRAKIVATPAEYGWSSYPACIGKTKPPAWLETKWLLGCFGKRKKEVIKNYKNFVEDVDIKDLENPNKDAVGGFILGGADFVGWVKDTFLATRKDEKEVPELKKLKPRVSTTTILQAVCDEFGCTEDQIREKGRNRNKGRAIAIYLSRYHSGLSCKNLGKVFGGISGAGITMTYKKASREIAQNKRLKGRINRIKRRIFNI